MAKKKVNEMLKGIAITGASVTGASILTDANLAYAAELSEEEVQQMASEELVVEVHEEEAAGAVESAVNTEFDANVTADVVVPVNTESVTTSVAEQNDQIIPVLENTNENIDITNPVVEADITVTENETADISISEDPATSVSESESVSNVDWFSQNQGLAPSDIKTEPKESLSELTDDEKNYISESSAYSDAIAEENEALNNQSAETEASIAEQERSIAEAISEADKVYHYYSEMFSEAGYEDEKLESLIKDIEKAQVYLEERRQFAEDNNQYLDHNYDPNRYNCFYTVGD